MSTAVEIRLIGELEVLRAGSAVALPASKKSRALLAYLVATGRPALRDRLCELLWDGPDDPRAALRWSLTKLRPLLDGDDVARLVADRDRIEFQPNGAVIDLQEVRSLTAPGVGAMTTDALRRTAALIRGELLDGLDLANCYRFQQWCAGEREALRQLHVRILGRLVDILPPGDEALAYARRRAAVDPFSEDAHVALIRLLSAMDRQHDALRHYDDCRALFERELGCRPSNALEDARRAVGRAQPARPAPPVIAESAVERQTHFIGREHELRVIDEIVQSESGSVVVITGEPGIGKSRLLDEIRSRSTSALYGRAFAAEMVRPYGVWIDALKPVAPFPDDVHDRAKLFDAVAQLLTGVRVLALDDVQWFDEASAALLHYVARAKRDTPLIIACAARSGELEDNAAALRVVRELLRDSATARQLALKPLSADEVRALAGSVSTDADAERIAVESGGNPLFAIELARTPQSHRTTLLETIGERLGQLEARTRDLVPWAAALGRRFDVDILGRATGMPSGEMLVALERLERASILRTSTIASDRCYDFTHDLIREAAYQLLSGPRRRIVHRQIARALETVHDPNGELAGEIVHHAALAGENELGAGAAVRAGERCLRMFAYVEAMAVASHGLQLAESLSAPERLEMQMKLLYVIVLCRTSLSTSRRELMPQLESVTDQAYRAGLPRVAALGNHLIAILHEEAQSYDAAASATLRSAEMSRGVDPATELLAVAATARCLLMIQRDTPRAAELAADAQTLSAATGMENAEVPAAIGFLHAHRGEYDRAAYFLERSLEVAARDQDHWREWIAIQRLVTMALERGDPPTALLHCGRMLPIAAKMTGGSEGPRAEALHAIASLVAGEREDVTGAIDLLRSIDSKGDLAYALNVVGRRHLDRGQVDEAEAAAREALTAAEIVDRPSEAALARVLLADVLAARGDRRGARAIIEPALEESRWADLTARAQNEVTRSASTLDRKEKWHGNHDRRTVL